MGVSMRHSTHVSRHEAQPVSREPHPETRMGLRMQVSPLSKGSKSRTPCLGAEAGTWAPNSGRWEQSQGGAGQGLQEAVRPRWPREQVSGPGEPTPWSPAQGETELSTPRDTELTFSTCLGEEGRVLFQSWPGTTWVPPPGRPRSSQAQQGRAGSGGQGGPWDWR